MNQDLIYGADKTERVVSIEPRGNELTLFIQDEIGNIRTETRPHFGWSLAPEQLSSQWESLTGDNHFKWRRKYSSHQRMKADMSDDKWCVWDFKEAALIAHGLTHYKGMKLEDVSVLSFDIEATSLEHDADSKVLLITNTFKRGPFVKRKTFAYNQYETPGDFFNDWCSWVREHDPSIITGFNIFSYDLPYMDYCARMAGTQLSLGRDGSPLFISDYESKFRRDGSQFYGYNNALVNGRELVDTFFLSFKYDVARKYTSNGLKNIIKQEGLEKQGRQHYDASKIAENYLNPIEWEKIRAYAADDSDDALALFQLFVPAFFYLAQSVPKTLQQIVNGATGSQINSLLARGYLQTGHSIPKASEPEAYEGAISVGNPGVYRNVFKVDVASLYPSLILSFGIEDKTKDPLGYFQGMMKYFTAQRLEHKKLGKGDRYYKDLSESEKVVINSGYGFLGAPGLSFNSPREAARVTELGRDILTKAMSYAGTRLVNADTDSVSISSPTPWYELDKVATIVALNDMSPDGIHWEDDGTYDSVVVIAPKNYSMRTNGKETLKGASLKGSTREPAFREFIAQALNLFHEGTQHSFDSLYHSYVSEIHAIKDIRRFAFKRTVTETLYQSARANETKVVDALDGISTQMGDKVYLFYDQEDALQTVEKWTGSNHSTERLLKKLYMTAQIFSPIFETKKLPNYTLKRNKLALSQFVTAV